MNNGDFHVASLASRRYGTASLSLSFSLSLGETSNEFVCYSEANDALSYVQVISTLHKLQYSYYVLSREDNSNTSFETNR
jgi:hypothetical protein